MNQFHTPSFGDEVFEMNETPMEQTHHQTAVSSIIANRSIGYGGSYTKSVHAKEVSSCFVNIDNAYANNVFRRESKAVSSIIYCSFFSLSLNKVTTFSLPQAKAKTDIATAELQLIL